MFLKTILELFEIYIFIGIHWSIQTFFKPDFVDQKKIDACRQYVLGGWESFRSY